MASSNPCAAEIAAAIARALGPDVRADDLKVDAPPRPELGDFAIGMFSVAKALRQPPAAIAARVAAELRPAGVIAGAEAAGPFVNVRIDRGWAFRWVLDAATGADDRHLVPQLGVGKVICIDYSSPNISKHLAYHHIRSTMLGHSLVKLNQALGYQVVRINHVGDWGTTHGMLLSAFTRWGAEAAYQPLDVSALNALYVRFRAEMKTDDSLEPEARNWFKRLEAGDPDVRARWQQFRDISMAEFDRAYVSLGVGFDDAGGESFYEDKMPEIVEQLDARGLLTESDGATVVQLPDEKTPLLIKTTDGTSLYATRDLAAALHRHRQYGFERSLYVVDRGQALHFRQLFKALRLMGFEWADRCEHVPFGLVRFGGKKTSTRGASGSFLLEDVFQEARDQVRSILAEASRDMSEAQLEQTARIVGVGAVVFANVLPQRDKDIDFDWDKVLSLSGDSGPYLQYTVARCWAIHRKAGQPVDPPSDAIDWSLLSHDAEWAVARRILDFGDHVVRAATSSEPHIVAHYLLDLAGDFSRWYTLGNGDPALRVICDDPALRAARLALVRVVRFTLTNGLALLGLGAPELM